LGVALAEERRFGSCTLQRRGLVAIVYELDGLVFEDVLVDFVSQFARKTKERGLGHGELNKRAFGDPLEEEILTPLGFPCKPGDYTVLLGKSIWVTPSSAFPSTFGLGQQVPIGNSPDGNFEERKLCGTRHMGISAEPHGVTVSLPQAKAMTTVLSASFAPKLPT
jgi:hypothetical protein